MNATKVHLKKKAETFDCNQCNKGFTRKDTLKLHTKVHRDKVETKIGFGTIGKEKERKVKLRKHFMCEKFANTFTPMPTFNVTSKQRLTTRKRR